VFGERDNKFFSLFDQAAANIAEAARQLRNITADPGRSEELTQSLEALEHKGDELTHDILAELNRAFITPIDREDIFQIAKEMDTVIDTIEATAHRFVMLNITSTTTEAQELAAMIIASADELVKMMKDLPRIKQIACQNICVIEINRIEDDGDKLYRRVVKNLYTGTVDALTAIRWREIYDHLEDTLDALEDVANVVEGIAMKHA